MNIHGNYYGEFFATSWTENFNSFLLHKFLFRIKMLSVLKKKIYLLFCTDVKFCTLVLK